MRVGIIGAGKVGCALTLGLSKKGFDIAGVHSRSMGIVQQLKDKLHKPVETELNTVIKHADLIFITVPDTQIAAVAQDIASLDRNGTLAEKIFVHCSGALSSEVLGPLERSGAGICSLHPIQTFADRDNSWQGLEGIYFGYEGNEQAFMVCQKIVQALNGRILLVKKEDKPLYHAAACILSNYTVALSYLTGCILEKIGIDFNQGIKAFMPLLQKTVGNINELGPVRALTGPISRGDLQVVEGHRDSLRKQSPEFVSIYNLLARVAGEIAGKKGTISQETMDKLLEITVSGVEKEYEY